MVEVVPVAFGLTRAFHETDLGRRVATMAIGTEFCFENRQLMVGAETDYHLELNSMVANGLATYLVDRFGQPSCASYPKTPNCHTAVAAACSWMNPTLSDPNIDGLHSNGLRVYPEEVEWLDVDQAAELPAGQACGIAYPIDHPDSYRHNDGTILIAHSMLTLSGGLHFSVAGSGGSAYVGPISTVLAANQRVRPGSAIVHIPNPPRQLGTNEWERYGAVELSLKEYDFPYIRADYQALVGSTGL